MTQMDELRQAVDSISRHTGPMLSAYLSVNAAIPENRERAYLVRLKDAMDEQGVPEELQLKVREYVEEHVDLGAPEGEILERLEGARERAEEERQKELLDEIRESGVRGLDETVSALQEENRVYQLVMLWELEGEIRWCDNDGLAITDITQEECPYCSQQTRVRPLTEVLIDLAAARGARVAFLRGENERTDTLRDEFGGLAGLTRF